MFLKIKILKFLQWIIVSLVFKLKKLLDKHKIIYTDYKYKSKEHNNFIETYNIKTVPQLLVNDKLIGGYKEVKEIMKPYYDFQELYKTTKLIIKNLNKVIDINFYPSKKTKNSNKLHRPIGLGVQGLADVYCKMKFPFESIEAHELNKKIFETIYFASVESSCEISQIREMRLLPLIKLHNKSNKTKEDFIKMNRLKKFIMLLIEK